LFLPFLSFLLFKRFWGEVANRERGTAPIADPEIP
jgi:hypothetical protein